MPKLTFQFLTRAAIIVSMVLAFVTTQTEFAYSVTSTSTGNVTVDATVAEAASPPASPPSSPPPSEPPPTTLSISNVQKTPLSGTSYKFTWNTNLSADSRVDWGLTLNYELGSQSSAQLTTQHSITISGLTADTTYFAKISSKTGSQTATQDQIAFTTPANDFVPLAISDDVVDTQTAGQITVSWLTNKKAAGRLHWGKTESFELGQRDGVANTQSQQFTISGLEPLTIYFLKLEAYTDQENTTVSKRAETTGNPPVISQISATTPTDTQATFSWQTDSGASTELYVGTQQEGPYTTFTVIDLTKKTNHSAELNGLTPGRTYYYKIRAEGDYGADETDVLSIVMPDNTPPTITEVELFDITQSKVSVRASVNELSDLQARVIKPSGTTVTERLKSTSALQHELSFAGLTPNTAYIMQLAARDVSGNNSDVMNVPFTTLKDTTAPPNVANITLNIISQPGTDTQHKWVLGLSWKNPTVSDFSFASVVYNFNAVPNSPSDGTVYGRTGGESMNIPISRSKTAVYPQRVYIGVFTYDTSGNVSSGALTDGQLNEPEGEPITDQDGDGVMDQQDNCPLAYNPNQEDEDGNGIGDACEDGQGHPSGDSDGDGVVNQNDNCPNTPNPDQADADENGIGDACEGVTPGVPEEPPYEPPTDEGETQTPDEVAETPVEEEPTGLLDELTDIFKKEEPKIGIQLEDVRFTSISHNLILNPRNNTVGVLVGFDTGVVLPKRALPEGKTVESITLTLGTNSYLLVESGSAYSTTFIKQRGQEAALLTIRYTDGTIETVNFTLSGVLYGLVSAVENGTRIPLSDVTIELFKGDGSLFDATSLGQKNPTTTSPEGLFGFMVPNGRYRLRFSKNGYRQETTEPFDITNNIINRSIELLKKPAKLIDVIDPNKPLTENVLNVTENVQEQVVYGSKIVLRETIKVAQHPEVEEVSEKRAAPTIVAAAAVNTAAATGLPALARFAQLIFTQPLLLLNRRKRRGWGTVYDALTKNPIDLAYVRLIDVATGRVVRTKITDKEGRFTFFAEEGTYRIEASKQHYTYPTQYLKGEKNDGRFADVYHSEVITVQKGGAEIRPNIPLDPVEKPPQAEEKLKRSAVKRKLQLVGSFSGIILSAGTVVIIPSPLTASMLVGHLLLMLIARRLAFPPRPKDWGIVYNARTRRPLQYAIARVFDTEYNKLLDTQLTDAKGRYAFLASQRTYYVTYEKKGYEKKKSNIFDLTQAKEPTVIGEKVMLKPSQQGMTESREKEVPATATVQTISSTTANSESARVQSDAQSANQEKEEHTENSNSQKHYTPPTHPKSNGYAADGEGS